MGMCCIVRLELGLGIKAEDEEKEKILIWGQTLLDLELVVP